MATITMTLAGDTIGTVEGTFSATDAGGERLLAWAVSAYGEDEEGNARTPQEAVQAAMTGVCNGIMANANRHAKEEAVRAAREAIADEAVTPS